MPDLSPLDDLQAMLVCDAHIDVSHADRPILAHELLPTVPIPRPDAVTKTRPVVVLIDTTDVINVSYDQSAQLFASTDSTKIFLTP
jgi:hypothetical protein